MMFGLPLLTDDTSQTQGAIGHQRGQDDCLESTKTVLRALSNPDPGGQEHQMGVRSHCPGMGRLHLEHRVSRDGSPAGCWINNQCSIAIT